MIAKLEPEFMPAVKAIDDFKASVAKAESTELYIAVERNGGLVADEKARRVGQSVAAASLPKIK